MFELVLVFHHIPWEFFYITDVSIVCIFRNLQAAVCAYYDLEQPTVRLPCMAFVQDITIGEGESIPPNTEFIKTWRIQNSGNKKPKLI